MFKLEIEEGFIAISPIAMRIFVHRKPQTATLKRLDMGKELSILACHRCWLEQSHVLSAADNRHARVDELEDNIAAAIAFVKFCGHKQISFSLPMQKAGHGR